MTGFGFSLFEFHVLLGPLKTQPDRGRSLCWKLTMNYSFVFVFVAGVGLVELLTNPTDQHHTSQTAQVCRRFLGEGQAVGRTGAEEEQGDGAGTALGYDRVGWFLLDTRHTHVQ